MLITFNGTTSNGQFLGDTLVSIKAAWLFAQSTPCDHYILALSPKGELNFLWRRFIDTFGAEVVYDTFHPGNMDERFAAWDKWHDEGQIDGRKFDVYRELYRRIDGGNRQGKLCGKEAGLGRKNVFEYMYFGQENVHEPPVGSDHFGPELIYHDAQPCQYDVLIAPDAKCQGNSVFTHDFWRDVVRRLVASGVSVTVNREREFLGELNNPLYRKIFPPFEELVSEVCRHRLVACGNTGVGWLAAACGIPLLGMQPVDSHIQDYRYEWCGVKSLIEFVEEPDVDYVAGKIISELETKVVLTTGCYDILHTGHIRHLEESRSYGDKLVVAVNSDASVRRLKGEGRPYQKEDDRVAVLRALRCVDEVIVFDKDTALPQVQEIRPAVLTNGSDHKGDEVVGRSFVEACGGRVVITGGARDISTTKIIKKIVNRTTTIDVARACRDGARVSPNPMHKMKLMADQFLSVASVPGSVADLGAYRGGCSLVLKRLCGEKRLHVFDTWTGTPHDDPLCHHKKGEWAADLAECKAAVGEDKRTFFHQGIFPASATGLDGEKFCFVYIDPDTYQTVSAAIDWFWPRMEPGGKMMFDDYGWEPCSGVQNAVQEKFEPSQVTIFQDANAAVVTKP